MPMRHANLRNHLSDENVCRKPFCSGKRLPRCSRQRILVMTPCNNPCYQYAYGSHHTGGGVRRHKGPVVELNERMDYFNDKSRPVEPCQRQGRVVCGRGYRRKLQTQDIAKAKAYWFLVSPDGSRSTAKALQSGG
jgi:hypothetical protein